ncbi:tripartite tricarboxylate transporter substrate binding protein [Aquabacterium humicola]|uniref:tripartite tricarboxylate transporter substrate binding protein n=1 Tax=Aquabacterium humicola TaxID=3237377 RepID=UPI002542F8C2|nr:tripartite tricarboxylate transporter substrate binding protein [Rubrivivax pictus]
MAIRDLPAARRRALVALAGLGAGLLLPAELRAAEDDRPLRIVLAYPPGGVSDEVARLLADRLAAERGTPVLVEHRPGGGGGIAMEMLARAAPDGRLLVFSAITPLTLLPRYGPVRYQPQRDIAPVAAVMSTATLVAGTPALPADSFAQLLALARARPGALRWATTGVGTTGYRVLEAVGQALKLDITHIPYKGGGQSLQDALGGQFEVMSTNVAPAQLQYVAQRRLKALAVGAPRRLPELPDVPTLAELGVPDANLVSRFGLFAPAGTPRALRRALNAEVNRALREPALRERLRAGHNAVAEGGVEDFEAAICAEMPSRGACHWG